jgi:sulfite reductase (NADPH) flavoprotein alpha-component
MTIQTIQVPAQRDVPLIPESAPFSKEQRAWLNGFFAGVLSLDVQQAVPVSAPGAAAQDDDGAPWHDASMPMTERMDLAEGKPLPRKLYAAMAQQDCGQCGYLCESYAKALAEGAETKPNLCVPGGKETSRMLKKLLEARGAAAPAAAPAPAETAPAAEKPAAQPGYSREAPVEAVFLGAKLLNGEGSEKATYHIDFDLSVCGLDYDPGDSFGVIARNDPALVDAILAAMRAPADFPIAGKTFREALIEDYALGLAPDTLFELLSYVTGGERRQKARLLAKGGDPDGDAATLDVLGVLEKFAPVHPDPEAFLESLEPLQPRLYSISSSPAATPGKLALTVDVVRYTVGNRERLGVASTFLSGRIAPGDTLKVYIQKAHGFALPADPGVPAIMVGPGTGVAPFRSFLWHRKATGCAGRNWLFFGHQRESCDFYYREELAELAACGTLTKLSTAWSRDGAQKVYVQDRMREAGAELWAWLQEGAHFYICGDAKRMAKDVETTLVAIAAEHGGMDEAAAKSFLAKLKADGRYQADVY